MFKISIIIIIICIIYNFMEQSLVSIAIGTNFVMGFLSSVSKFMKKRIVNNHIYDQKCILYSKNLLRVLNL